MWTPNNLYQLNHYQHYKFSFQMMSSFESMGNVARSESVADLNAELTLLTLAGSRTPRTEPVDLNSKSFGIGRVHFSHYFPNFSHPFFLGSYLYFSHF